MVARGNNRYHRDHEVAWLCGLRGVFYLCDCGDCYRPNDGVVEYVSGVWNETES